jgi:hypothetical protein
MVDRRIIDEWLAKAEDDFRFAEMVLSEEKEYYNQICFHFQQCPLKTHRPPSLRDSYQLDGNPFDPVPIIAAFSSRIFPCAVNRFPALDPSFPSALSLQSSAFLFSQL